MTPEPSTRLQILCGMEYRLFGEGLPQLPNELHEVPVA